LEAGDFIGEIGFFTESPQVDSVACLTVCKTLTISQSAYKLLAQDHPGSVGKILQNLLAKVEELSLQLQLPKTLPVLCAGSVFDLDGDSDVDVESEYGSFDGDILREISEQIGKKQGVLTAVKDLVKMHMSKQLDDQTTRLLFTASRGDTGTISLMCDQGFDPNNADYDNRTALMVASMKGNTDAVKMLLEYKVRDEQSVLFDYQIDSFNE
jgi:ankyrin repeat protein